MSSLPNSEAVVVPGFDVGAFLQQRAEADDFLMVEFGHDTLPVADLQFPPFTKDRRYIGVESWLRGSQGSRKRMLIEKLVAQGQRGNISFVDHNVGAVVMHDELDGDTWLHGEYNARTGLPDNCADEVFLSNVFSDRYIAWHADAAIKLLTEVARIVKPTGTVVVRHTITASQGNYVGNIKPDSKPAKAGLSLLGRVAFKDEDWAKLERVYKAEPSESFPYREEDHYFFLKKDA